ncbi:MAG: 16S rRNA (guanine(966)-N(2))-methyltransferase RsmD [Solobacterium sp.]|nr:16S rRNA (guanine(966)-N(2))-methyltransferase RsmD [Solobacterium sp.]
MRIIAGEYRSRILKAPKGMETRPTLDKVREAVFSSIGGRFEGGSFLDLYAGSGANGLEALSRGMDFALLNDISHAACQTIRENVQALGCGERCRITKMSDAKLVQTFAGEYAFDYVYMDPPYRKQRHYEMMSLMDRAGILNDGAVLILESGAEDSFEEGPEHFTYMKSAVYGTVRITYYRYSRG